MIGLATVVFVLLLPQSRPAPECGAWHDCRARALEAAERRDFETFHDFAWRAVQSGPRNDPALMQLLARAQSLSGRPGDALVMLQRLAAMGVVPDASGNDFEVVRRLPRWPEVEAQIESLRDKREPAAAPAANARPAPPVRATAPPAPPVVTPAEPKPRPTTPAPPPRAATSEALRFTTPRFTPGGFAYDSVSRRFIVGHREARKLSVVDEFSGHIANLSATGFADVTALEIDARDGTLWVVSAGEAAGATAASTSLHKLQLISGRALGSYPPPKGAGARFVDVAVGADGAPLVLDAASRRIFRLANGARSLSVVASLGDIDPISLAPSGSGLVFVAHADGIARVALGTRKVAPVTVDGASVAGVEWLRWHGGALIGLQKTSSAHRVIRIRPNGRPALDVLHDDVRTPGRAVATISRDVLYLLASGTGSELVIERLQLK